MALTNEQIFQAADDLAAAGQDPTLAAVRKALGGGSFTTISEAMKEWKASRRAAVAPIKEPPPPTIAERLEELGAEIWAAATEAASARLQAEREALETVRADMERQQAEAAEMADQMSAEIDQLKARAADLEAANEKLRDELALAQQKVQTAEARYSEQGKRIDDAREELYKTQQRLHEAEARERATTQKAGELESAGAGLRAEVKALEKAGTDLEKRLAEAERRERAAFEEAATLRGANGEPERA